MKINNRFDNEQEVYLKTDPEQYKRIITGILIKPGGTLKYELTCETDVSIHYEFELSAEVDMVTKTK